MSSSGSTDRRTAIIRAVWQVIAESGMGAVSIRNVASAAGISVGQIQYWFPNKDELIRSSLEEMLSTAAELYAVAVRDLDDRGTLWKLITQPIPRAQAPAAGVAVFHQYVAAGINHPILAEMLAEAKHGAEKEAARLLRRIAPDLSNPRTAARSLIATADGLAMRVLIGSISAREADRALRLDLDRFAT